MVAYRKPVDPYGCLVEAAESLLYSWKYMEVCRGIWKLVEASTVHGIYSWKLQLMEVIEASTSIKSGNFHLLPWKLTCMELNLVPPTYMENSANINPPTFMASDIRMNMHQRLTCTNQMYRDQRTMYCCYCCCYCCLLPNDISATPSVCPDDTIYSTRVYSLPVCTWYKRKPYSGVFGT